MDGNQQALVGEVVEPVEGLAELFDSGRNHLDRLGIMLRLRWDG
jgi:hypothetical protein